MQQRQAQSERDGARSRHGSGKKLAVGSSNARGCRGADATIDRLDNGLMKQVLRGPLLAENLAAITERLGDMKAADAHRAIEIGDGACNTQRAMETAR